MDGQFPDAEGWSLEKEKFFIELLHTARGHNNISGGRLENNVLVSLQNRMNVEFGGFTETSVLNRFNMLRRRCKIFNVIFSDSDFKWNRVKNWITAPKHKWDALIAQYPDVTKYQLCGESIGINCPRFSMMIWEKAAWTARVTGVAGQFNLEMQPVWFPIQTICTI
ncbi:hypothetical protein BUALT_Bualt18G0019400 [Buddleja alternifolia]|uniref:Myb/SANT-like domain-containing protein n=1 Tax=Buddleja alternifolia TaxID=168488 RepID=A0AAV6WCD8_9LAMI|nr:hypothetical protein BUALT_Bualt18G0019400 [Buddleja alternifolia]